MIIQRHVEVIIWILSLKNLIQILCIKKWLIGEREYFENIMMIESGIAGIDELKNRPDITEDDDMDDGIY